MQKTVRLPVSLIQVENPSLSATQSTTTQRRIHVHTSEGGSPGAPKFYV